MMENLLEVKNLHITFHTYAGKVQAVRGVNFEVKKGKPSPSLESPDAAKVLLRNRSCDYWKHLQQSMEKGQYHLVVKTLLK